ncbi:MAG: UDP-N-acetylmuramoyl-tripeptide--D-alanyl-D-alanine ligase [Dethiobacter sp.]|jgi:UDP-N-acetylmuramoyl-tripeptide--D-alanyl-D-alanine ligase|nr:UDP-N-acetylmuramoyl-tripeptide--D-alanyl-D-alanine ligase [Dethiobacter sp.]
MEMNCREILAAVGGRLIQAGDMEKNIRRLIIDSRDVEQEDFFVPLPGEKSDGHFYLADAASRGAAGCFIRRGSDAPVPKGVVVIEVIDPLESLQCLATFYRDRFTLPVVAVTGSTGKTTTKDLIAAVLSGRLTVLKTEGNLNNQIGVPLMLSRLDRTYTAAVLEMGMSGLGEVDLLARLARPTVGVITNIGEAHLEMLGSRENIARAKCELLSHLPKTGSAVVNGEEPLLTPHCKGMAAKLVTFGFTDSATLRCVSAEARGDEKVVRLEQDGYPALELVMPLPGRHNISNLMAAVAVGREVGLRNEEIKSGLANLELTGMRLETVRLKTGITVINDAYNASPMSVAAAIDVLMEKAGNSRKIAVLGDMLELGILEEEGHRNTGRLIAKMCLDALVLLGERAKLIAQGALEAGYPPERIHHCLSHEEAAAITGELACTGCWILLKGSRGMCMEKILTILSASNREG